ncbi:hypothetical protein V2O64_19050 [Verrucomicrobiaceae bacterium 227]
MTKSPFSRLLPRKMRRTLIPLTLITLITTTHLNGFSDESPMTSFAEFRDPRQPALLYHWIDKGTEVESPPQISRSLLIICWSPGPKGEFESYQISGIDGFHTRERTEAFLETFYKMAQPKRVGPERLNLIVAGNNWGSGKSLQKKLMILSKEKKFNVFYAGGWGFQKAILINEPPDRLKMIKIAFQTSAKVEPEKITPDPAPRK